MMNARTAVGGQAMKEQRMRGSPWVVSKSGAGIMLALLVGGCGGTPPEETTRPPSHAVPAEASAPAASTSPVPAPGMQHGGAAPGAELYSQHCQGCHGSARQGVAGLGPSLAGAGQEEAAELAATIRKGKGKMPAFGGQLARPQMDALVGYLQQPNAGAIGEARAGREQGKESEEREEHERHDEGR